MSYGDMAGDNRFEIIAKAKAMEFSKILDKLAEISEIGQEANK